jgi:hypothetical protein
MVDINEIAKLILLQVKHNQECGKDDKFTIEEIENIIERRIYETEMCYTFSKDDLDKLEGYLIPFHDLTNGVFDYGAYPNDPNEELPKEIQDKADEAESSLILIEALFNARKNKN